MAAATDITISLGGDSTVSGLWLEATDATACLVLAHGAGAGMTHRSVAGLAEGLAERRISTLRYQFPFMERGSKRPDPPPTAHAAVRAAALQATRLAGELPLFAGGRSFGGRMTSQAQAVHPLPRVRGLVLFAFPLHPAGKPSIARADHLFAVKIPMLFVQGTRDDLADIGLLRTLIRRLEGRSDLAVAEQANHSFHVPVSAGRKDSDVLTEILDRAAAWMSHQAPAPRSN
jgi:predicted alpha/beta-hydrolase family hydrolase